MRYFAYGSNMATSRLGAANRAPSARSLGVAPLETGVAKGRLLNIRRACGCPPTEWERQVIAEYLEVQAERIFPNAVNEDRG